MQTIYINGRFLTQGITGVQRYARQLTDAFDRMILAGVIEATRHELIIIAPENAAPDKEYRHIPLIRKGRTGGHFWEQATLPYLAKDGILLSPGNVGPVYHNNHIVTIHDTSVLAMPETFSWTFRTWYFHILKRLCRHARHIITVSHFSKSEIIKYLKADPDKISVVYHGHEHALADDSQSTILSRLELERDSYILAVGSMNRRKNFWIMLQAMKFVKSGRIKIVVAGEANPRVFGKSTISLPNDTICPGRVNDTDLAALYKNAAAFVFPSLYEGFGLPPLEAMAHGCPVIVSDIPPHHEVCKDAALYFDPHRPDILARLVNDVISDSNLRSELSQKALKQAAEFTWEKCARETWKLISLLAEGHL